MMMKMKEDLHHPELLMMKVTMIKGLLLLVQMVLVPMVKKGLDLMELSMVKTQTDLDQLDHPLLVTTSHHLMTTLTDLHPQDQMMDLHLMITKLLKLVMMMTPNSVSTTLM